MKNTINSLTNEYSIQFIRGYDPTISEYIAVPKDEYIDLKVDFLAATQNFEIYLDDYEFPIDKSFNFDGLRAKSVSKMDVWGKIPVDVQAVIFPIATTAKELNFYPSKQYCLGKS